MRTMPKIYLEWINDNYLARIQEGLSYIDLGSMVKYGEDIFIKPNLTYPYYKEGVMTNPHCIENLFIALKDYTSNIVVGESDGGGYNRFCMYSVFEKTGLKAIAKKYGVKIVNLSTGPTKNISFTYHGKKMAVPLPQMLLDEIQLFITVPVPKIHANTQVSMSIKNQWGCIPQPALRLELHPYFDKVITEVNRSLRANVSVIDGLYALNRNGPLRGDPVKLGWMMIADDIGAADQVCCRLMRIDPASVKYLAFYQQHQNTSALEEFQFNQDYRAFIGPKFFLRREFWDYPGFLAFRFPAIAYLAYHSPLAGVLHKLLYLFREKFYEHD
jgi:uncharacterized protein (DUF362 family)